MNSPSHPDRPRVAVVYRLDHPGGVQSCAFAVTRGLNRLGIIPDVIWDLPPNPALLEKNGVQMGYRPARFAVPTRLVDRLPVSLRYLAGIANAIDGRRFVGEYDFFYVFSNGFLLPPGAPHVRYLSGPPLLPQLEATPKGARGAPVRAFRWLYRTFFRRSRPVYEVHRDGCYVINSQYTAGLFAEAHGAQLPVVYPPINLAGRSFDPADLPRRDTLTFFSRIVPYKRPEMVLALAARHPDLRCVIMGGVPAHRQPYFEALQQQAREQGLRQVEFLANPSNERVRAELARTRYYVFPAIREHFGMTTAEAIGSGALPFVHDSGGQREIVNQPRLRFEDATFHDQFDALRQMPDAEHNALRAELGRHMRTFSEEVYVERMLAFLPARFREQTRGTAAA